jgi:uncharacterized protein (TIGR03086 family)
MDFPGEVAAAIATNEVLVHGWDIARASGQPCDWPPELVEAAVAFVAPLAAQNPEGVPGMFGPARPARDRNSFSQLLALTGRDSDWRPSRTR